MATRKPRPKQGASLQKLKSAGLYSGRVDKRKLLTPYQQKLIAKYDDVVKGRAAVVQPVDPAAYRNIGYQVIGKGKSAKVIVPKAKGERVSVNKRGEVTKAKRGKGYRKVTVYRQAPPGKAPPVDRQMEAFRAAGGQTDAVIPLATRLPGGGYGVRFQRFTSQEELERFLKEYDITGRFPDWRGFVMLEHYYPDETQAQRDQRLNEAYQQRGLSRDVSQFGPRRKRR